MFKNPHCDCPIAVHLVCCLSALTQIVLWSRLAVRSASALRGRAATVLGLSSIYGRTSVLRM